MDDKIGLFFIFCFFEVLIFFVYLRTERTHRQKRILLEKGVETEGKLLYFHKTNSKPKRIVSFRYEFRTNAGKLQQGKSYTYTSQDPVGYIVGNPIVVTYLEKNPQINSVFIHKDNPEERSKDLNFSSMNLFVRTFGPQLVILYLLLCFHIIKLPI